ncbi:MAG: MucR family transcriptional regulator [Geobacteraceae bacterium]|nr:MucR family transcriptional regulator [Geobacteraceae bacterium]
MANLIRITEQIVTAFLANNQLTSEKLNQLINEVYATLQALEAGSPITIGTTATPEVPKLTIKQAFKKDEVVCMVCGKGGFKILKRHIGQAHGLKPGQYRKQFGIPSSQSLSAKSYSESRRQTALDNNLADGLAKARAKKAGKKAPVPVKRAKAAVPAVKAKAPVPAVRKKPAVPAIVAKKR